MEFTAGRNKVLSAVKVVAAAAAAEGAAEAPGRNLAGVLIEAKGGTVTFSATDLQIFLCRKLAVGADQITDEGRILVPAKRLAAILSDNSQESVTLTTTTDGAGLQVKTSGGRIKLSAMVLDDYPDAPKMDKAKTKARINAASFQVGVERCGFCVGKAENARYALGGLLLDMAKDKTTLVGTDTHRLSVYEMDGEASKEPTSVVLPTRAAGAIADLAALDGEQINIETNGQVLRADTRGGYAISTLIDGTFPRYVDVMPKEYAGQVTANKDALVAAVRSVSRVADDDTNKIDLAVGPGQKYLVTAATGSTTGEGAIQVAADIKGPEEFTTSQNHKYLADALKAVAGEVVNIAYNDGESPLSITEGTWNHIIMPIRDI